MCGECDRVAGWRAKILPIIEQQDARDPFDIHVCGDCILARLARLGLGGDDQRLRAATEQSTGGGGGGSTALAVAAKEQLPAPPVQLGSALAEHEQWQISRRAHPGLTPLQIYNSVHAGAVSDESSLLLHCVYNGIGPVTRAFVRRCHAGCSRRCCSW
jgi:hypothetical protein